MLEESIVRSSLRRHPKEITTVLIGFKGIPAPRTNRIWRVSQDYIKLLKLTAFNKRRILQSVRVDNLEVQNAVAGLLSALETILGN